MSWIPRVTIVSIIVSCIVACSSDPKPVAAIDTVATGSTIPIVQKPLTPDANWTHPTEIVSQYGPSGIVRDVAIDQNGIVWLAAWDGIVSYDGKEFTNHTLKNGLSHHRIYSLMQDSKGNIWFGSMRAGVYKYDGSRFINLNTNHGLLNNRVFDLFEDTKGNIWFASDSGVSMYNGKVFRNYPESDSLKGNAQAISQDRNGNIWIGTSYGLYILEGETIREIRTEYETPYSNVRDLYAEHSGDILIAAARGLYRAKTIPGSNNEITLINDKFTGYVCEDNSSNMLITSDGISRFDGKNYEVIVKEVSNLGIFGAQEDAQGTIWYGAMDGLHSVKDGKDVRYKKQ